MPCYSFYNPVKLWFGNGMLSKLGEEAAALGHRALLVTGRSSARASGLLDRATAILAAARVDCALFEEVIPNPTDELIDRGGALARSHGCDLVIGLGGGSAMDSAKGIAVAATHPYPIAQFLEAGTHGPARIATAATLPTICVTTTSGTSSQLTPFAVATVGATRVKNAIGGPHVYPRVAISDPELTLGKPPRVTAATGIDVLCHSVEGFINNITQPIAELVAQRAIALVHEYLPAAVADGTDLAAREMMSQADVFAGYSLSNCGATVMHALEHPISGLNPDVPHGEGLAALLVPYARLFRHRDPARFGRFAELLGADITGLSEADAAERAAPAAEALLEMIGLKIRLRDLGVDPASFGEIADGALGYMTRGIVKTPGEVTREDLIELLEASY
jgi:alcohol dehydrogenase